MKIALIWGCVVVGFLFGTFLFYKATPATTTKAIVQESYGFENSEPKIDKSGEPAPKKISRREAKPPLAAKPLPAASENSAPTIPTPKVEEQRPRQLTRDEIYQRVLKSTILIAANQNQNKLVNAKWQGAKKDLRTREVTITQRAIVVKDPLVYGGTRIVGYEDVPVFGPDFVREEGPLSFEFFPDGVAVLKDTKGTTNGTWKLVGNEVTIDVFGGLIFEGALYDGKSIVGNARMMSFPNRSWSWEVKLENQLKPVGVGSGALIDRKNRLIITCDHVVGPAEEVIVLLPFWDRDGNVIAEQSAYVHNIQQHAIRGKVVFQESRTDLALIKLDWLPDGVKELPIAPFEPQPNQQVHSVGNPVLKSNDTPGKVRQVCDDNWHDPVPRAARKIETNSAINPSDSGGPLVNERAELIGVASSRHYVRNISNFIAVSEIRDLLKKYYKTSGVAR